MFKLTKYRILKNIHNNLYTPQQRYLLGYEPCYANPYSYKIRINHWMSYEEADNIIKDNIECIKKAKILKFVSQ